MATQAGGGGAIPGRQAGPWPPPPARMPPPRVRGPPAQDKRVSSGGDAGPSPNAEAAAGLHRPFPGRPEGAWGWTAPLAARPLPGGPCLDWDAGSQVLLPRTVAA